MRLAEICAVMLVTAAALAGCEEPVCGAVIDMDPCDGGSCQGNSYCGVDGGTVACVPRKANGEACTRNAECLSNFCDVGTCTPLGPCF